MTRLVFPLATHPATILFLPWLVLVLLFGMSQGVRDDTTGYWVGTVSSATEFMILTCSFASVSAALAGSRIRRARLTRLAPVRSLPRIALVACWPILLLSAVLQATGLAIAATVSWGSPSRFPWEVVAAWAAMALFHLTLGFALGLVIPAFGAAPAALLLSYVWLGFTWSVSYVPLRYLAGMALSGCCTVESALPLAAPITAVVFSLGAVAGIALLLTLTRWSRRRFVTIAVAAVTVFASASGGLALAQGLGYYPSTFRSANELECRTAANTSVCLFPEQRWGATADADAVITAALHRINAAGVITPTTVSGSVEGPTADSVWLVYRRNFTEQEIRSSLMSTLLTRETSGADGNDGNDASCPRDDDPLLNMVVTAVTGSVLYRIASDGEHSPEEILPEAQAPAAALDAFEPEERARWINTAIRALHDCSVPLPALPGDGR